MRARVFIDFWNFQLGWNDATNKAKCSWSTLPTVLVKEAGKLLAATGDTSGLVLDETIVHASVEDAKEANLRAWLTGWLAKQPSYAIARVARAGCEFTAGRAAPTWTHALRAQRRS